MTELPGLLWQRARLFMVLLFIVATIFNVITWETVSTQSHINHQQGLTIEAILNSHTTELKKTDEIQSLIIRNYAVGNTHHSETLALLCYVLSKSPHFYVPARFGCLHP